MFLPLLFVAFTFKVYAIPTPLDSDSEVASPSAFIPLFDLSSSSDINLAGRTMVEIVRSCAFTIFACIYTSLHHNIPHPDATPRQIYGGRLRTCFYALIAPEAVIWWAARQWSGARKIASTVNSKWPEWTTTHSHFVQMGGLEGIHPDGRREVIDPLYFNIAIEQGDFDMDGLRFSKKQINDCSKGDLTTIGLATLQTSWYILQCIARHCQHLPLTVLEIVTLAFALLNIITYILWWDKPLNMDCQRTIHIKNGRVRNRVVESLIVDQVTSTGYPLDSSPQDPLPQHELWKDDLLRSEKEEGHDHDQLDQRDCKNLTTVNADSDVKGGIGPRFLHGLKCGGDRLILHPFRVFLLPFREMVQCEEVDPGARHVPAFYALPIHHRGSQMRSMACGLGYLLGWIPLLAFTYQFPTRFEFVMWRCSTIIIMVIPCSPSGWPWLRLHAAAEPTIKFLLYYPVPFLYILARVSLVILAFLALRDPQPGVFQTGSWTSHIPHF
ncbi:hypothetical protein BDN72DRAFT_766340 [Pluteus cervinus]|uniref:Uncharacterized protein n=1 Tax=Pluteus cervinus TaxID=181527 RepID=A0ACD3AYP9_9AGAR|nr:hypothetical protein BDN72DRAFT_766340 [Pluteus cervinus]